MAETTVLVGASNRPAKNLTVDSTKVDKPKTTKVDFNNHSHIFGGLESVHCPRLCTG